MAIVSGKTDALVFLAPVAAREVSQRGGGARRGSEAPELMSPQGEIQAERAKRRIGAGNGGRTRDIHLGKVALYH